MSTDPKKIQDRKKADREKAIFVELANLEAAFMAGLTKDQAAMYVDKLSDLPLEELHQSIDWLILNWSPGFTARKIPTIAEIRKRAFEFAERRYVEAAVQDDRKLLEDKNGSSSQPLSKEEAQAAIALIFERIGGRKEDPPPKTVELTPERLHFLEERKRFLKQQRWQILREGRG